MSHFVSWSDYRTFAHAAKFDRRYIRTQTIDAFLNAVLVTAKSRVQTIPKDWNDIWRAQRGSYDEQTEREGKTLRKITPYMPERMKPRDRMGREGRVNPKGISCFYCATTPETAMAEVRPWMGQYVSLARFKLLREVRILDCSKFHSANSLKWFFVETFVDHSFSAEEIEEAVWTHIDRAFSEPVTDSDDLADYVPTQILAELFKSEGYDAISYKSMLTDDGYNLAFFDHSYIKQVQGTLYKTAKIRYEFSKYPMWEYSVDDSGSLT
jgi:RES domain